MKHGKLLLIIGIIIIIIAIVVFVVIKNKKASTTTHTPINQPNQTPVAYSTFKSGDPVYSRNVRPTGIFNQRGVFVQYGSTHPANGLLGYFVEIQNPQSYQLQNNSLLFSTATNPNKSQMIKMSTQPSLQGGDIIFIGMGSDLYTK